MLVLQMCPASLFRIKPMNAKQDFLQISFNWMIISGGLMCTLC